MVKRKVETMFVVGRPYETGAVWMSERLLECGESTSTKMFRIKV